MRRTLIVSEDSRVGGKSTTRTKVEFPCDDLIAGEALPVFCSRYSKVDSHIMSFFSTEREVTILFDGEVTMEAAAAVGKAFFEYLASLHLLRQDLKVLGVVKEG